MVHSVHKKQDSLFSAASGWKNYSGFFNLAILLLFVSNSRVALENLLKYGILISPVQWIQFILTDPFSWPNLTLILLSNITIVLVSHMERALAKNYLNEMASRILYFIIFSVHIMFPAIVTLSMKNNPLYSSVALFLYVIVFLKLTSYAHTNHYYRQMVKEMDPDELPRDIAKYPRNLNWTNLYYFILAPTLCYEISFPRTAYRRKSFIIKRSAELIFLAFTIIALSQQWMIPILQNSLQPFETMEYYRCLERVLKLAIPNHVIWLICFYTYFHSALNLLAELCRFADREFYLDFWNAETIAEFWKTWNIPAHRWALRHVYVPLVSHGISKFNASLAVFFISAFFHEYLVSVPLHMFRFWAYYGMMAQIPLNYITENCLKRGRAGNIVMWLSLILGQPMTILMYLHDWYVMNAYE